MESLTKNRQTFETICALVDKAYGAPLVPQSRSDVQELGHGWFNVAYKVKLADGSLKALKIAPAIEVMSHELGAMQTEWAAIDFIQRHSDVPVAPVEFADDSRELLNVPYFFMPFIDGLDVGAIEADLSPEELDHYEREVGVLNRKLNELRGPRFGPITDPRFDNWVDAYRHLFENTLRDGERRNVDINGWSYGTMREIFETFVPYLRDVTEPRYIEQDMWPKAVIFKDGKPLAHIDHERAYFGDPILEAGFIYQILPEFGHSKPFLEGYGKEPLTGSEYQRRLLYTLHLALIMVIESVYRGFEDPDHLNFVHGNLDKVLRILGYGSET